MTNHFTIETIIPDSIDAHLAELSELLHTSVLDGASISFILPFSQQDAYNFWANKIRPSLAQNTKTLLVAKAKNKIAGCVMLNYDMPPNQPHRAEIAKLLVHPNFRRRGLAKTLMTEIEQHAIAKNHKLLVLDTANAGAEKLYTQLGYKVAGVIPDFALNIDGEQLEATTIMYKKL